MECTLARSSIKTRGQSTRPLLNSVSLFNYSIMLPKWLRRILIFVADTLLGASLYLPLAFQLLKSRRDRLQAIRWEVSDIPRLNGKVALVTGARYSEFLRESKNGTMLTLVKRRVGLSHSQTVGIARRQGILGGTFRKPRKSSHQATLRGLSIDTQGELGLAALGSGESSPCG